MKLKYLKMKTVRVHPTLGAAKPVFEGDDLEMTLENGTITVLSTKTGKHFCVAAASPDVDFYQRSNFPAPVQQQSQGKGR